MKKIILISSLLLVFFGLSLNKGLAQNDTIYIMKNGGIIWEYAISDIDSIIFYNPVIEETSGTFVDLRDTTEYSWIKIGEQIWMAENLKYLPSVVGPSTSSNTEAYYYVYGYYDTDVEIAKATAIYITYGALYNWVSAINACPVGWHLPSNSEWTQLTDFLGDNAGGKLKEAGTEHWTYPNTGATNESGFTALPGGSSVNDGFFYDFGNIGNWWSATEYGTDNARFRLLSTNDSSVSNVYGSKSRGFSIRCVKD